MKNKEIEELLNMLKKCAREEKATLKLNEIACKTISSHIEQLEKRNKEIYEGFIAMSDERCEYAIKCEQLENNRDKAIEYIEKYKKEGMGEEWFETSTPVSYLLKTLKGDSDE